MSGLKGVVVDASVLIKSLRVDEIIWKHEQTAASVIIEPASSSSTSSSSPEAKVELFTVPEVLQEVRNHFARQQLQFVPYDFTVREPAGEFMKQAIDFAKATGDFFSLSMPDLKIIALCCQLEWELAGRKVNAAPPRPVILVGKPADNMNTGLPPPDKLPEGFYFPQQQQQDEKHTRQQPEQEHHDEHSHEQGLSAGKGEDEGVTAEEVNEDDDTEDVEEGVEDEEQVVEHIEHKERNEDLHVENKPGDKEPAGEGQREDKGDHAVEGDDEGWITPSNIKKIKEARKPAETPLTAAKVACITTDFAMQNVLLQMRVRVISFDGLAIRTAKTWVLRCHACFKTTGDMSKQFCPTCGNNTLIKTSCSIDENGVLHYHLKKNFQYRLKGTKYSIPQTKGGKHNNDLILREDQKEYERALKTSQRKKGDVDIFDPDYVPAFQEGKSSQKPNVKIGYGRRNPNEPKNPKRRK